MEFPRQEYWSGLPFPFPRNLPDPGIELTSPTLAGGFFTNEPPGKPLPNCLKPRTKQSWRKATSFSCPNTVFGWNPTGFLGVPDPVQRMLAFSLHFVCHWWWETSVPEEKRELMEQRRALAIWVLSLCSLGHMCPLQRLAKERLVLAEQKRPSYNGDKWITESWRGVVPWASLNLSQQTQIPASETLFWSPSAHSIFSHPTRTSLSPPDPQDHMLNKGSVNWSDMTIQVRGTETPRKEFELGSAANLRTAWTHLWQWALETRLTLISSTICFQHSILRSVPSCQGCCVTCHQGPTWPAFQALPSAQNITFLPHQAFRLTRGWLLQETFPHIDCLTHSLYFDSELTLSECVKWSDEWLWFSCLWSEPQFLHQGNVAPLITVDHAPSVQALVWGSSEWSRWLDA